jgi:hypothetical protein
MQIDPDLTRVKASVENVTLRSPRHHPRNDRRDHMRIMLPGTTLQSVRPFEPVSPEDLQFPLIESCDPAINTRQSPGRSESTCSTMATTSRCCSRSPVFCISTTTAICKTSTPSGWLAADHATETAKECHCVRQSSFCCRVHHDHQTGFKTSVFLI